MKKKEMPKELHIFFSPTLLVGLTIAELLMIAFTLFYLIYEPSRNAYLDYLPIVVIIYTFCGIVVIAIAIYILSRLARITIDETGITRALFGKFYKMHISWDDMTEAFYFCAVADFIAFSATKKLSQMPIGKARKYKNSIEMTLDVKRYAVILQYLKQPIVGMPDRIKAYADKKVLKRYGYIPGQSGEE